MDTKRVAEAEECMKRAEKFLKTSLMKWKPDFDNAAAEFDRAAICFKNAKASERCLDAYEKAADAHLKNEVRFHAAKSKEQAAYIAKDLGLLDKAKSLMEEASELYAETGTAETSAMALGKAGQFFETIDYVKAVDVYEKAFQMIGDTEKSRKACEFLHRISRLHLKHEMYQAAADTIEREIELCKESRNAAQCGVLTSGLVIVYLQGIEDSVAANKAFQRSFRVKGFEDVDEARLLHSLIEAYDNADGERLHNILDRPHLKGLDGEFIKLMRNMKKKFPKKSDTKGNAKSVYPGNNPTGVGHPAAGADHEEDDFGGSLR